MSKTQNNKFNNNRRHGLQIRASGFNNRRHGLQIRASGYWTKI